MAYDLLIRNGTIVDGSGAPRFVGDVVVDSGRIVSVGRGEGGGSRQRAAVVVEADGRVVAPGFIDPHTHVDPQLWWDPFALPLILHGVTSVMTGNCAVTLAPCKPGDSDALASIFYRVEDVPIETLRNSVPWSWGNFDQYLQGLDGRLGINCAALVGHCAIRYSVMGPASLERAATDEEVRLMRELVRDSIRAGAIGFSTSQNVLHVGEGGVPIPSRWADRAEIIALGEVIGEERRGIIQTDGGTSIAQRAEWVRELGGPLAEQTGRTVLAGNVLPGFAASQAVVDAIAPFHERGVSVYAQVLPSRLDTFFTISGGNMSFSVYPSWQRIASMTDEEQLVALRDPALRDQIQRESVDGEISGPYGRINWDRIRIFKTINKRNRDFEGRSVVEVAKERGVRIIDALLDVAVDDDLKTQLTQEADPSQDADIARYLKRPETIVGASDAGAHVRTFCGAGNTTYILSKWVREDGVLTLEEAVKRITFEEAQVLGFQRRGLLKEGYAADVVVFDPEEVGRSDAYLVNDLPGGGERVYHDARGVDHVIVNGRVAVSDGNLTGELAGQVICSQTNT